MNKAQVLCLSLALLASFVSCQLQNDGGYCMVNTPSNGDPNSCILSLTATVQANDILFTAVQSAQTQDNVDCTQQNLQFYSIFRNAPSCPGNITLTPSAANASVLTGTLTQAQFNQYAGCACADMGQLNGEEWLICNFQYGSIFFIVDIYVLNNNTIDTNWTNFLYPIYDLDVDSTVNGMDILTANTTYQALVGMTYNGCGSWSNVITNCSSDIIITGTQLQSNNYDLSRDLSGLQVWAILVRDMSGNYKVWQPSTPFTAFANAEPNYCTDLGVSYKTVLSGMNCSGGCFMSLLMYNDATLGKGYFLMTEGFSTA